MSILARLRSFLSALVMRRRVEREMDEEWQFHLDARVDALAEAGMPRGEAERMARTEFGDRLRWKEQGREARGRAGRRRSDSASRSARVEAISSA